MSDPLTWLLALTALLLIVGLVLTSARADALRYAGAHMDRRQPNRLLTVLLALVVLALLGVVPYAVGADALPQHPPLAHVLLDDGGRSGKRLLPWLIALLAVRSEAGVTVRPRPEHGAAVALPRAARAGSVVS